MSKAWRGKGIWERAGRNDRDSGVQEPMFELPEGMVWVFEADSWNIHYGKRVFVQPMVGWTHVSLRVALRDLVQADSE